MGLFDHKCDICEKETKKGEWMLFSFNYRCFGSPMIPESHKWCRLRRFPKDLFWITVDIFIGIPHSLAEYVYNKLKGKIKHG